jgi:hypothetical protein
MHDRIVDPQPLFITDEEMYEYGAKKMLMPFSRWQ